MKSSLFALVAAAATALVACSTNISPDFKLPASPTSGLIVGSITYTGVIGARQILIQNTTTGKFTRLEVGQAQTLNPFARPDVDVDLNEVGGTFATELATGSYVIGPWYIRQGPGLVSSATPIGIPFVVESGKTIYLGNFHFVQTSRFGLGTGSAEVTLEEKAARDLPVLKKRYPVLETTPLTSTIGPNTKIVGVGGVSSRRFTDLGPIFVPVKR
jgi:hypothetical protein